MKTSLFATLAATLLTATSAFAVPVASQYAPGYPPAERGRGFRNGYDRMQRYDYRPEPSYGYERERPVLLPPQPRRPVAVSSQVQL